jgi:hypothetical protein
MKKISVIVSTVVLAGLCGCSSNSGQSSTTTQATQPAATTTASTTTTTTTTVAAQPPPKPKKKGPIESRLTVGMSMDDVKQACGNPRDTATNSDGSATWTYVGGSPTYTPWGGWGSKWHQVIIMFDASGKVKSWSTSMDNTNPANPY